MHYVSQCQASACFNGSPLTARPALLAVSHLLSCCSFCCAAHVRLRVWAVQLLHPQTTLQLCFLAVAVLREAVTCYDIISWALDAQLPFLELPDIACQCLSGMTLLLLRVSQCMYLHNPLHSFFAAGVASCNMLALARGLCCAVPCSRAPTTMLSCVLCCTFMHGRTEAEASALPVRCLQPEVSLSPIAFINRTCMLAGQLGLQLPHIAGEALLLRSVQELALPQVHLKCSFWSL